MRYTLVRDGVPIGDFEAGPVRFYHTGGTLTLRPGFRHIWDIVSEADIALHHLGFPGGVNREGERRGRAAVEALADLQESLTVQDANGRRIAAIVVRLTRMDQIPSQLGVRIRLAPSAEGDAHVGANVVVPPSTDRGRA